ncbi:MAG TPA: CNNM domain-containing protein [Verrucomicrobiae bacterium]|nr:CNNM domain-containing protein [Verrucomicrobiae bacterium]
MDTSYPTWTALALCLAASFLLSGMEAGVFALNRLRIRRLARTRKGSARILNQFLEKPERFLWTILVGNTLVNFIILGWSLVKLREWFLGQKVLIVALFAVIVFLFYAFFDLLPKMLFRAHPNSLCLLAARPFRIINFLLSPIVVMVEDVSQTILKWSGGQKFTGRLFGNREEMRALMRESGQALSDDEHAMINRILDLQNLSVGQVALPMASVPTVEVQTPLRAALDLAREHSISRLPVLEMREGERRVAGLLDIRPLVYREALDVEKPVADYMTPAVFINEGVRLEVALRLMQRAGQRTAIVLSRERREMGVVKLKDILRVMFGEMKL